MEHPEISLAYGLSAIEPEKVEGGSKKRQDWLTLVLGVEAYLIDNGFDYKLFEESLNDIETPD